MRTVDLREQEIFLDALEIASPVARLDFIYQACGENVNLRERVQELLALQNDKSCILDRDITLDRDGNITTQEEQFADLTGQTVGRYHLVKMIGSGGMGDVYLAEQREPIRRRVAVKVIKLGMDTKSFIARFSAERQALAVMDHHGITKIYDAGSTDTGRPYFAMELVSGEPITKFCDDQRLGLKDRIDIFIELCKSIQHAHQKGLIHRDLKPSNILVNKKQGKYVSKVIDFGVSKATHGRVAGQTDLTRHSCMIGTPEYMSPEQTDTQGNDQDIRTDIYSLGAILYELLTGTTTFETEDLKTKNLFSIREIIQTRAVEMPSVRVSKLTDTKPQCFRDRELTEKELVTALKGNLDAVTLKCLSKDRAQRYSSVAELISDLELHLKGESVAIGRQSLVNVYSKKLAKYKWLVLSSLACLLALFSIVIFSLSTASRASELAEQAQAAELLAKERLRELVLARQQASLEKSKTNTFQKQYLELDEKLKNQKAILSAIVSFNQNRAIVGDLPVSKWILSRFPPEISELLPQARDDGEQTGDYVLLKLIVEKQRAEFGATNEMVAESLDLLGEKYLNSKKFESAIETLRESLYIHTVNDNSSEARVRTMILLTQALRGAGRDTEADSQLENIRKNLKRIPADSRFHGIAEKLTP